jgi:membrane protein YqaA with SNARE-associated domain
VKAGGRLAINASPEPVTNIVASLAEDVAVVGVVLLAIQHPWLALVVAALFLLIGGLVVHHLLRLVRRGWRRWKGRPAPA